MTFDEVLLVQASAEHLRGYLDAACDAAADALRGVTDADLDRVVDEHWDPPVTLAVRLVSVVERLHPARGPGVLRERHPQPALSSVADRVGDGVGRLVGEHVAQPGQHAQPGAADAVGQRPRVRSPG